MTNNTHTIHYFKILKHKIHYIYFKRDKKIHILFRYSKYIELKDIKPLISNDNSEYIEYID